MSRQNVNSKGLKLPQTLQDELGIELQNFRGLRDPRRNGNLGGRTEKGKAERDQKRHSKGRNGRLTYQKPKKRLTGHGRETELSSEDDSGESDSIKPAKSAKTQHAAATKHTDPPLKSILKKPANEPARTLASPSESDRSVSPGLVLDRTSKPFRDRRAQDDAEIRDLERKLGIKSKKLPKSFEDDGLEDLLEGLGKDDEAKKRKREGDTWLQRKRLKAELDAEDEEKEHSGLQDLEDSEGFEAEELEGDTDGDIFDLVEDSPERSSVDEDFEGLDESESEIALQAVKQRENPYIAPVPSTSPVTKYIPPSLRKASNTDTEALERLRRQIQGHLNKLSEANSVSILAEIEKLYQANARQDVTLTLTDLLLSLFCDRSALQPTFVILHAAFIAALYKVIGTDFGAEVVAKVIERWDYFYKAVPTSSGKECINLTSLLSHLYTFHVVSSNLIFDHVRLLLEELSELNTELILKVVRDSGPQLRQDDPSSLKDIVHVMQNASAKAAADGRQISVRTKFMIETIIDLKNNKINGSASVNGVAIEHITRMRKILGSLNNRTLRATEPLRFGRQDIRDGDKKGKWWLVGASWKGNNASADINAEQILDRSAPLQDDEVESEEANLSNLARVYRMNTSIRRSIFIAIMSATDFQDAHLRLLKLRLKRAQEQEIPRVLLRCAAAEGVYNPYYTLIAKKLCTEKKMKMAFQFALWDFLKRMGEKGQLEDSDDDDNETEPVELKEIVNLAKMYGQLLADGMLSVGLLKILNLTYLKEQAKTFVELLLIVAMLRSQDGSTGGFDEKSLSNIFMKVADTPQLLKSLLLFIKKVVSRSDLLGSKKDRETVRWGCRVAADTLHVLSTSVAMTD